MKKAPQIVYKTKNDALRTVEKKPKNISVRAVRNIAALSLVDSKNVGQVIKKYLKDATDAGIINEVRGKTVAGFYMVNVSLEKRVFQTGNMKKRIGAIKKERCKVKKSSFDQRSTRNNSDLLYI